MKILWISHILPYPPKGGVMQRSYNLIKEITRNNDVYLFAFNQKAWLPTKEDVIRARKEFLKICKKVEVFNLPSDRSRLAWYKLVFKSLFSKDGYTVNWTKSNEMKKAINEFLKKNLADVIHCDTISLGEYVKNIKGIPKVLNHHNIESHMIFRRARKEKNLLKKAYFYVEFLKLRNYEKHFCPNFNMNLVVSELDKDRLQFIIPELNVEVIPNGVDINYFQPQKSKSFSYNIVFAASMDWYPNEEAVIYFIKYIWPFVKKHCSLAKFIIVGRNPTPHIRKLVEEDSSLGLTGYVDDVRPYIDRASVYVCPILDGGGTKLKLLDAMAMEKAIVSTSIGAEGLEIKNEVHMLIADDPKNFASQIIRLFENQKLREYLGQNARQLVEEKYSWETIGKKLKNIYLSLR